MDQRFRREERLKSRKLISRIFREGELVKAYPLMLFYLKDETLELENPQIGFSVPAKKIRKAVDRNLVKRRMREAYRLNKAALNIDQLRNTAVMLVYVQNEIAPYQVVEQSILKAFRKLSDRQAQS